MLEVTKAHRAADFALVERRAFWVPLSYVCPPAGRATF